MLANTGFTALLLVLTISCLQPIVSFVVLKKNYPTHIAAFKIASTATFLLSAIAFLCLVFCYVLSDFSVSNVYQNSHSLKPLIYKISGTWGNHEGSMLMLLCILNFYAIAFAFLSKINDKRKIITLAVQSLIIFGFTAFIVFTSNPFLKLSQFQLKVWGLTRSCKI